MIKPEEEIGFLHQGSCQGKGLQSNMGECGVWFLLVFDRIQGQKYQDVASWKQFCSVGLDIVPNVSGHLHGMSKPIQGQHHQVRIKGSGQN